MHACIWVLSLEDVTDVTPWQKCGTLLIAVIDHNALLL